MELDSQALNGLKLELTLKQLWEACPNFIATVTKTSPEVHIWCQTLNAESNGKHYLIHTGNLQ